MSFRMKTILGIALVEFVVMAVLISVNQVTFGGTASAQLYERAQTTARLFSTLVSDAVIATDLATLDSMVATTLTNDELVYLRVLGADGSVLAEGGAEDALAAPFRADADFDAALTDGRIDMRHDITIAGLDFGGIELGVSTAGVEAEIARAVRWNAVGAGLGIALVAAFGYLLGSILTRQLSVLRDGAMALEGGDLGRRVPVRGRDELAQTATYFNRMADALAADRAALVDRQGTLIEKRDRVEEIVDCMRAVAAKRPVPAIPSLDRADEIGDMARATAVFRDAMAEVDRVREEQDRLITAFDRLTEGVVVFGTDGRMLFCNRAFRRANAAILDALGPDMTGAAFLDRGIALDVFPDLAGTAGEAERVRLARTLAGEGGACEVARAGGRRVVMRGTRVEGVGTVVTASDVTALRESQAQLIHASKLATLGEMAAGMAHELNQPLGVIRMAAANCRRRLARGRADPDYLDDKLDRIAGQTERAARIIDHMRIFGRKDDDRAARFDLAEAVGGAVTMMQAQLSGGAVTLTADIGCGEAMAVGPRVMFEQVVVNLIANARDAIAAHAERDHAVRDDAPGTITVSAALSPDGTEARITVCDTGGGVPEHLIERLYEPFFTTKEPGKGTGLGLSISYSVIAQMGGTIAVENTEEGACFRLTLPVEGGEAPART